MRCLIIADVHGNLPALEAVLASPEAQSCTRIISLGDQVNFCPQSREVVERLRGLGAVQLMGNHEERILRVDDPAFSGYNWELQRWTARQLKGVDIRFPAEYRMGPCLFTHGMPGEIGRLVTDSEVPPYLDALPADITHLFTGHSHLAWHVRHGGKVAVNPGSVGVGKATGGGRAAFCVLDADTLGVTFHTVPYDVDAVGRAFIRSGAADAAPQMCRVILESLYSGQQDSAAHLVRYIARIGKPLGLTPADKAAWLLADSTYPWAEPMSTADYWSVMKEKLL